MTNMLIGCAYDTNLVAVLPSPGIRVTVTESLNRDLGKTSECCDLWGIKLNASTTMTMIFSRSRTMHPQSPPLIIGGTVLKESDDLDMYIWSDIRFQNELGLRNIFVRFPEQLLKLLVSWGSPGECSMIGSYLGDAFLHDLSCPFCSTVLHCGARLQIHTLN